MKLKLNKDQAMVLDVVKRAVEDKKCTATISLNEDGLILSLISLSISKIGSIEFDLCVHNSESIISWINDLYRTTITIDSDFISNSLKVGDYIVELDVTVLSINKYMSFVIVYKGKQIEQVTFEQLKGMNASRVDETRYIDINW